MIEDPDKDLGPVFGGRFEESGKGRENRRGHCTLYENAGKRDLSVWAYKGIYLCAKGKHGLLGRLFTLCTMERVRESSIL